MVNAFWFYQLKMEFLLFECLQDLTGGDLVFLLGVNSLLVDSTTTDERTTRLIILDAFRFCGRAAGMQIAAQMKTQVGWTAIFGLNFVLIAANFVYILLCVKDKKKPAEAGTSGCIEVATSILSSYPNLVFRQRPPPRKPLLLATFLSLAIFYLNFGQDPLWYLFFRLQYGLSMVDYAHISTAWAFRSAITNFILLPVLLVFFQDTTLVMLAVTLTSTAMILVAFGTTFTYLLLTGFLFALYWPIEKISSSIVSKLVEADEVGTAFSLLAVMSKCIGFVARPVFAILYKATVDIFPGTFAVVSVGGLAIIFVIMLFIHIGISRRTEIDCTSSPPEAKE